VFRRACLRVTQTTFALLFALTAVVPGVWAQANVQGQWSTLNYTMTINPIHVALMHNGKILVTSGSGNCPPSQSGCPSGPPYGGGNRSGAVLLDPAGSSITQLSIGWDIFCNGMTALPDGRILIVGGTIAYDPFEGSQKSTIFDPANNSFTDQQNMAHGRWYPTVIMLGDGRIMAFSGTNENGSTNNAVEFFTAGAGWSQQYSAPWTPPLYPRLHLLPNGKVFASASQPNSHLFNPGNTTWSLNIASTRYGGTRIYGSSVLLPLTPANNYDPVVMILGGNNPSTATTELIDMGSSSPSWQWGPDMSQPRIEMDAVMLPTGQVLALGGSASDEDGTTASLHADLYDPSSNRFSSAGSNVYPRLYHTVSLLLPDATVWLAGSNPTRGNYETHMEIYKPAYLFNSDGSLATRPSISSAPGNISWGGSFTVSTPDAANISQVVLMRPGSSTHGFDFAQRLVGMSFTAGSSTLTVTAPPNGNIAPPGYYMLFLINNNGVPSVASFVLLNGSGGGNPAPTVTAVSPNSGSAGGGTGVTITGTNFASGATVTFGGSAATNVTVVSSTSITAKTPSHGAGTVSVVVKNSDGQTGTLNSGYSYANPAPSVTSVSPNSGSSGGATGVTITGTNFLSGATVSFGGAAAANVNVVSSTSITATTPTHATGAVNVVVANSDGQSATLSNGYTYVNTAPSVASVTPASGPIAGGTGVTITGTNFVSGATVSFGGTPATGVTVVSSTSITATTPTHAQGAVDLVVTNSNGQNGTLPSGYTYNAPADFSITASPLSPSLVAPGGSATSSITVTGLNGFTGTVNLSCSSISPVVSPAPTCTFSPASITGSGKSTLTFRTTAGTKASLAPGSKGIFYGMWLPIVGLVGLGAGLTSRQKRSGLLACLLFVGLVLLTSCGGGGSSFSNSGGGLPGTPADAYTVTISATGPVTHTASLSVTVN
jgi:hypothetical protein